MNRRWFLKSTALCAASCGSLLAILNRLSAQSSTRWQPATKVRVGRVYLGNARPGWPMHEIDLPAEVQRYEVEFAKVAELADVEFVDAGIVSTAEQLAAVMPKFENVTGILAIHVSLRVGPLIDGLMKSGLPVMVFTMPYNGHEWHIIGSWQRQGRLIDIVPSSRYEDVALAVRPFRAMHRLREARVLHVSQRDPDTAYCEAVRQKFGTEIVGLKLPELQAAYDGANAADVEADCERWMCEAEKIVEPPREEILKGSRMYIAMRDLLEQHRATALTMNCLGMGLMNLGMGYPCLGFVRFNNELRAGVCEADLKSTMTQLIFTHLVGRTGFVSDPMFDLSNNTIIHAHCVAATQMEGPDSQPSPYHIRTHLEDNRGVSLQVRMPVGRTVSMARLIGTDNLLFSTGEAIDSPFVDRGCRSKLTMRVENIDRMLTDWSSGLHRVITYGDHSRDLARYCRLMQIRILREGIDDLQNVPGLEWEPRVHA